MASKPELLQYQAADEIGQDFLLAYQRAVLLALQQQGVLNEPQFKDCVQKLEKYTRMNGGNEYVERITVCHNVNHLFWSYGVRWILF